MLIDWFTVGAQLLNFLVLAWLLKRFLYQPVLDAIDAREARIAKQIGDAQATQHEAALQRDAFKQKVETFDEHRAALLKDATQAADAERARLLAAARQAADALSTKRQGALATEAARLDRQLGERARAEVFAIARQALTDLAGTSLEAQLADVLIRRLRGLDASAQADFAAALQSSAQGARVRSAFDLPAAQQAAIQAAVADAFGSTGVLQFERAADLICGIELLAGGQKLSWSIANYLTTLEHLVSDEVAPPTQAAP